MEEYKKKIKFRIVIQGIVSIVALLLVAFSRTKIHSMELAGTDTESYFSFQMGLLFAWFTIMITSLWRYIRAVKSQEQLKRLYIKEHDERSITILTEANSTAYWISILLLLTAATVSAFYNDIVFFTLAGVVFFMGMIGMGTKIYYRKKL